MVKIYNFYCSRPDLLVMQRDSFLKFLGDSFRQIIVINCVSKEMESQLRLVCDRLGLEYIITSSSYMPNVAFGKRVSKVHADLMQRVWDEHIRTNSSDIVVLLDCDIMPDKPFSFTKFLGNRVAGVRRIYGDDKAWRNFLVFNMATMPKKERVTFPFGTPLQGWLTDPEVKKLPIADLTMVEKVHHYKGKEMRFEYFLDTFFHLGNSSLYRLKLRNGSYWLYGDREMRNEFFMDYMHRAIYPSGMERAASFSMPIRYATPS